MTLATISRRTVFWLLSGIAIGLTIAAFRPVGAAAVDPQPHMKMALETLRSAQAHLALATADKGGHRVKAEEHVKMAIAEVEEGIKFDNRH